MAARVSWATGDLLQPSPAPRFDGRAAKPGDIPARDQHRDEIMALLNR